MAWSGGKDSALALDRAIERGLRVTHLLNVFEGSSGRVRFHGVRAELIRAQADALGLALVQRHTHPHDFETVFLSGLDALEADGVRGIIFGNIHLADVRAWYEERTSARGLAHVEPLWGGEPATLVRAFLARGWRTRVAGVNLELGRRAWLGRELDAALAAEMAALPDVDAAGEKGEYHTFVFDGPRFRAPLAVEVAGEVELEGHALAELRLAVVPPPAG